MRKLTKVKWINTGPFPVHLGFCNTKKAWGRFNTKLNIEDVSDFAQCGRCDEFESASGGLIILISMNYKVFKKATKRQQYSMLAHEAKHAHDAIMDYIKEFKRDGECSAYTIDWLVTEGSKAFKL